MKVKDTAIRSADIDLGYFDLNKATKEQLADIIEITPERASELLRYRPFKSIEDVALVPGFTEVDVDALRRGGAYVGEPVPADWSEP